jgi:hypothetical protein
VNQALATGAAVPLVCWSIAALLLRTVPPARRGRHSAGPAYARFHGRPVNADLVSLDDLLHPDYTTEIPSLALTARAEAGTNHQGDQ